MTLNPKGISREKLHLFHLRVRSHRERKLELGLCTVNGCKGVARHGYRRCAKCVSISAEQRKAKTLKGICTVPGCKRRARLHNRKCRRHHRLALAASIRVRSTHFFVRRASKFNSQRHGASIIGKNLWSMWHRQRGICALSGRKLSKENAWIDHIVPVAKGGTHEIQNLQWTTKEADSAKRDLTDMEFLTLCRDVVNFFGRRNKAK